MINSIQPVGVLLAALLAPGVSWAADFGRWYCAECEIMPLPERTAVFPSGDIDIFIKSVVNPSEFRQIPGVTAPDRGWKPNDTISICAGGQCIPLIYHPSGRFLVLGPLFPDIGFGYKNRKEQNSSQSYSYDGVDGATGHEVAVTIEGRWVRDVMYIDGSAIFYGSPYFMVTGFSIETRLIPGDIYQMN